MKTNTVQVKVRYYGGAWVARAGRGKHARAASSTNAAKYAVQAAAAKFFRLDSSNVQGADDIEVRLITEIGVILYSATLPERASEGGAA